MSQPRLLRPFVIAAVAVVLVGIVIAHQLLRDALPAHAGSVQARLELAAGAVRVSAPDRSFDGFTGAALPAGSAIETAPGARAMARLSDGTALFLRDSTKVELGPTGVNVTSGEVFLESSFTEGEPARHRFGDAVLSAGEAGVAIRHGDAGSTVVVTRGAVVVTSPGGRVEARAGEQVELVGGKSTVSPVAYWEDWTGGLADHAGMAEVAGAGSGRIYGVQLGGEVGAAAASLEIQRQSVRAVIRSGLAETEVDQVFFNPFGRALEGWFWFTVPDGALVSGFAVETNGVLVEAEFVEKSRAAAGYSRAAASGQSPAILEWVNERTARARIYPIPAMGSRRVVLRYLERLPVAGGELRYAYPLRSDDPPRIGEFSLSVDLGEDGADMEVSTLADATVEDGGRRVTMRRSGFTPHADFVLEATAATDGDPLRVSRFETGADAADYLLVRYVPDIAWEDVGAQRAEVVLVVDTSGGADEAARRLQTAATEAVLRALSAEDKFAIVAVDVGARTLHPAEGLAAGTDAEISQALERLSEHAHGGATDLAASFDVALGLLHESPQPAVIYLGDGLATSGARSGEALREELSQALSTSRARLFTVGVGSDADMVLLGELARAGGGQALRIDDAVEATERALQLAAEVKAPTLTDLRVDLGAGLDEVFVSAGGKVRRGEEIVVLARTHHPLPERIGVTGSLAGTAFERSYAPAFEDGLTAAFAPKLWAQARIAHLLGGAEDPDAHWGTVARMGAEYGLLTPYSSLLALPNEQAYAAQGIQRVRSALRGVRLVGMTDDEEDRLRGLGAVLSLGCGSMDNLASPAATPEPAMQRQEAREEKKEDYYAPSAAPLMDAPPPELPAEAVRAIIDVDGDVVSESAALPGGSAGGGLSAEVAAGPRPSAASARVSGKPAPANAKLGAMGVIGRSTSDDRARVEQQVAALGARDGEKRQASSGALSNRAPGIARGVCSDLSARPVADRIPLWKTRVANAEPRGEALWEVLRTAYASCEIDDYRSQSVLASILARQLQTEGVVRAFLVQPMSPAFRDMVARAILRRSTDPAVLTAVEQTLFATSVDWVAVDRRVQETADMEERLRVVREAVARAPDDPRGALRLVRLLAQAGRSDELMLKVRGLQDRGVLTAQMAREVGDILARSGRAAEAVRAYSEIIEFDPEGVAARRMLGDTFLAHRWYDEAYRQYEALVLLEDTPLHRLRMALAAGGAGRADEALRIERAVGAAPGDPGANDPRAWARLWSAARLAGLIAEPPKAGAEGERLADSLRRRLKEQQLFVAPGSLVIVSWENLDANLVIEGGPDVSEATDGAPIGIAAVMLPSGADASAAAPLVARLRSESLADPLRLQIHRIGWDGARFEVVKGEKELAAGELAVGL